MRQLVDAFGETLMHGQWRFGNRDVYALDTAKGKASVALLDATGARALAADLVAFADSVEREVT